MFFSPHFIMHVAFPLRCISSKEKRKKEWEKKERRINNHKGIYTIEGMYLSPQLGKGDVNNGRGENQSRLAASVTGGRAHFPPRESLPELHDGDNSRPAVSTSWIIPRIRGICSINRWLTSRTAISISRGPTYISNLYTCLLAKFVCLRFFFSPPMKTEAG